jgi:hypothetical protein
MESNHPSVGLPRPAGFEDHPGSPVQMPRCRTFREPRALRAIVARLLRRKLLRLLRRSYARGYTGAGGLRIDAPASTLSPAEQRAAGADPRDLGRPSAQPWAVAERSGSLRRPAA